MFQRKAVWSFVFLAALVAYCGCYLYELFNGFPMNGWVLLGSVTSFGVMLLCLLGLISVRPKKRAQKPRRDKN